MGYLSDLISGDDPNDGENRLSRIFSATFNHSPPFRKAILGLLDERYYPTSTASIQESYRARGEKSIIDILLKHKNRIIAIIENKIDATLTGAQLKKYNQIREFRKVRKRFCFVKSTSPIEQCPASWKIIYWHDIHSLLLKKCSKDFFSKNFMEILEEHNMITPQKITNTDLKQLAKAFHQIRYQKKPWITGKLQVFETVNKYNAMLAELWIMAKKDEVIQKRIGRSFRPVVSWWDPDVDRPKRGRSSPIWIGAWLRLPKPYKTIKFLTTGLYFSDKPESYNITSDALKKDYEEVGNVNEYTKHDLVFAEWSKQVLNFWKRKLR